jgi:hypothetical protein
MKRETSQIALIMYGEHIEAEKYCLADGLKQKKKTVRTVANATNIPLS